MLRLELNVKHARQGGSHNGGRDSLAEEVRQRHVEHTFVNNNIKEVAAHGAARNPLRLDAGKREVRDLNSHYPLLHRSGYSQLVFLLPSLIFQHSQLGVVHHAGEGQPDLFSAA